MKPMRGLRAEERGGSDWSSDVCSSDLNETNREARMPVVMAARGGSSGSCMGRLPWFGDETDAGLAPAGGPQFLESPHHLLFEILNVLDQDREDRRMVLLGTLQPLH